MPNNPPLKRSEALQSFSREHHHGLLLCWKINAGIKKGIEAERILNYARWFYDNHLVSHFKAEEKDLFPLLGNNDPLIRQALSEHRILIKLFTAEGDATDSINMIPLVLENHIRFEERILFPKIQRKATAGQFEALLKKHAGAPFFDNLSDVFWK